MDGLNSADLNNQEVNFHGISEKMKKFNALKSKIST
jgi:hypothetical protein